MEDSTFISQSIHYKKTMHYWGPKELKSINNKVNIEGQNPSEKASSVTDYWRPMTLNNASSVTLYIIDGQQPSIYSWWHTALNNVYLLKKINKLFKNQII
jgi:hypothetical protein